MSHLKMTKPSLSRTTSLLTSCLIIAHTESPPDAAFLLVMQVSFPGNIATSNPLELFVTSSLLPPLSILPTIVKCSHYGQKYKLDTRMTLPLLNQPNYFLHKLALSLGFLRFKFTTHHCNVAPPTSQRQ